MSGLIVWSVLCFGFALFCGASEDKFTLRQLVTGLGIGCMVWASGLAVWHVAGVVVEVWL